jgi:hypothetical protein
MSLCAGVLALACSLAADHGGGATRFHAVAYVTDPLSHGTLGDSLLSLEEAILLHNGQLAFNQLSPTEQGQLSLIPGTGNTTDVTWIDIDGTSTPVITIERDLSPVLDTSFGLLIKGFNEAPVFDFSGTNLTRGLLAPANSLALEDLVFSGGPYGVDVVQTDVAGQSGATLRRVRFENQAQFGLRVRATTPGGIGRVILEDCAFANVPEAVLHDESGSGRTTIFEARNLSIRGSARGLELVLGSGGSGRYTLDRFEIDASITGLRILRPFGASRLAAIESTALRVQAPLAVSIETTPLGLTSVALRLWHLSAGPAGTALLLGAAGHRLIGTLDELTFEGAARIAAGASPVPLALANLRGRNASISLATDPVQPFGLSDSRFDQCQILNAGSAPITFVNCCVFGGSLGGTANAPMLCSDSHLACATTQVQQTRPLAAPQLGSMSLSPHDVLVGASVQLHADLPAGLAGIFLLGSTDPDPILLPQPFHLYSIPALTVTLPGIYRAQQSLSLPVPNQPWLAGFEFVAQLVVVADPGMVAPPIQLPPGRRFVLR